MLRHISTLFLVLITCYTSIGQKIMELEKRNGFKDLKLGMKVDSVKGTKFKKDFKEHDEFDAKVYSVEDPQYSKIGEVAVNRIEIKTYRDFVYQIHVFTDKDPRLMKALESIYGLAEYDIKGETYFWKASTLLLRFKSISRNEIEMTYTSFPVLTMMKEDKGKKVQDIADDF